ncbi:MAG: anion permease [Waddliaceae bacterium]
MSQAEKFTGAKIGPFLLSLAVGLGFWFMPVPEGLEANAWHLLAIFLATIVGIITKALPMGGMTMLALTVLAASQTLTIKETLSGFSYPVIWLIVLAFFIAKSFVKTGLGIRIAYLFVALLGRRSLGLAYGMAMTDLALAPAIPSSTARGGGIVYPVVKSLALTFDSSPEKNTQRKIGAFLIQSAYHCNIITSAMFLTAMAANPMIAEMAKDMNLEMTWGLWALAASVPGIISLAVIPLALYKLYPPEIKETPQATTIAREHLHQMGKIKTEEWITLGVFFFLLFLWIFGSLYGIDSTTAALAGVSVLLVTGVLSWNDMTSERAAWDTLFWFATLIMMASFLSRLGLIGWISTSIQESVESIPWYTAVPVLILGYFYSHYLFASITAHVSSMFAAFSVVGIVIGVPPLLMVFILAFCSNLSACITHYGTGPGPILFGSGYVGLATWWKLGGIISIIHLVVWVGIGSIWWKLIGLW